MVRNSKLRNPKTPSISEETLQLIQSNFIKHRLEIEHINETPEECIQIYINLYNKHGSLKVTVNNKEHSLPTTKEYILKDYARCVYRHWNLTRASISYTPVRTSPYSVPVRMYYAKKLQILIRDCRNK